MADAPKSSGTGNAREQILALAARLRADPKFLAQIEGAMEEAKRTHKVKLSAFNAIFTRKDVIEALGKIQKAAKSERLQGHEFASIMPHSEESVDNAVAAAIVAAAASTAAAAFV